MVCVLAELHIATPVIRFGTRMKTRQTFHMSVVLLFTLQKHFLKSLKLFAALCECGYIILHYGFQHAIFLDMGQDELSYFYEFPETFQANIEIINKIYRFVTMIY
jgi:hypothetical protein